MPGAQDPYGPARNLTGKDAVPERHGRMQGKDDAADLALFTGPDEAAARAAYTRLSQWARRYLHAYLRGKDIDPGVREDVVQEALAKIWRSRAGIEDRGIAAWCGLLKRVTDRCYLDLVRARADEPVLPEFRIEDVPDEELPIAEDLIARACLFLGSGELQRLPDALWLGLDPGVAQEIHTRRLLAAQLFYLDGEPWHNVLRLLGPGPAGEQELTRELLDSWLSDPGVLRHLAYATVYHSNDRLASALLELEDVRPSLLDDLSRQASSAPPDAPAVGGWSWGEVAVLLWRYRYALTEEHILGRKDCTYGREELSAILDRFRARFPFSEMMEGLLNRVTPVLPSVREILSAPGLWQRLAFQYRYGDELPHRDVGERIEAAAAGVGYAVTPAMLNVWLAGRRLLTRLFRYCQDRQEANAND